MQEERERPEGRRDGCGEAPETRDRRHSPGRPDQQQREDSQRVRLAEAAVLEDAEAREAGEHRGPRVDLPQPGGRRDLVRADQRARPAPTATRLMAVWTMPGGVSADMEVPGAASPAGYRARDDERQRSFLKNASRCGLINWRASWARPGPDQHVAKE